MPGRLTSPATTLASPTLGGDVVPSDNRVRDPVGEAPKHEGVITTARRKFSRLLRRYNPQRRPSQAFWLWTGIIAMIVLFGVLGYAIPAVLTWAARA